MFAKLWKSAFKGKYNLCVLVWCMILRNVFCVFQFRFTYIYNNTLKFTFYVYVSCKILQFHIHIQQYIQIYFMEQLIRFQWHDSHFKYTELISYLITFKHELHFQLRIVNVPNSFINWIKRHRCEILGVNS